MRHINDGQLHAYLDGALHAEHPAHAGEVESHLVECGACRARLEQQRSMRERARSILGMAAPASTDLPSFEQLIRRPEAARRLSPVPLAWAASVVLALGLGWLARASLRPAEPVAETHTSLARPPESAPASEPPVSTTADPVPAHRANGPVPPEVLAEEKPAAALPAAGATGTTQALAARSAAPESTAIHGQVTDEDGRPLAGVQVHVPTLSARTVTGLNGAYALSLPTDRLSGEDTLTIAAAMVGRETERQPLAIRPGQVRAQDFRLRAASVALEALVVSAAANARSQWAAADRATAEQALGQPIRTVPDLPVLGIDLGGSGDVPVVRVRQRIGRTGTLVLEQTPEPGTGPVEREIRSAKQPGETELAVRLDGLRVTARARAPVDTLRAWLKRLQ